MSHSQDLSKPDYELLFLMHKAGMITEKILWEALGINRKADMIIEDAYEEKREKILQLCLTEATDIHLHNNIVAELLKYRSGDDPAFGNVVAEIYEAVTTHYISVEEATKNFHTIPARAAPAVV